jgi:hypothetical protein
MAELHRGGRERLEVDQLETLLIRSESSPRMNIRRAGKARQPLPAQQS